MIIDLDNLDNIAPDELLYLSLYLKNTGKGLGKIKNLLPRCLTEGDNLNLFMKSMPFEHCGFFLDLINLFERCHGFVKMCFEEDYIYLERSSDYNLGFELDEFSVKEISLYSYGSIHFRIQQRLTQRYIYVAYAESWTVWRSCLDETQMAWEEALRFFDECQRLGLVNIPEALIESVKEKV